MFFWEVRLVLSRWFFFLSPQAVESRDMRLYVCVCTGMGSGLCDTES